MYFSVTLDLNFLSQGLPLNPELSDVVLLVSQSVPEILLMLPAQDEDYRYILLSMTLNKNETWILRIKLGFSCLHSKQALYLLNYLPRDISTS